MGWQAAEAQIDNRVYRALSGAAKAPLLPGALIEHAIGAAPGSTASWSVPLGIGATGLGVAAGAAALDPANRR